SITVSPNGEVKPIELATEPYPGFPTDMQAQMCALLSTTEGISVITENIFPQRYMHVAELKRMGAHMQLEGASAIITGVDRLFGAPVMASDLRASAALVLAGLKAEGRTEVSRVYHIDRGYEHLDEKLSELGAHIERVKAETFVERQSWLWGQRASCALNRSVKETCVLCPQGAAQRTKSL